GSSGTLPRQVRLLSQGGAGRPDLSNPRKLALLQGKGDSAERTAVGSTSSQSAGAEENRKSGCSRAQRGGRQVRRRQALLWAWPYSSAPSDDERDRDRAATAGDEP